jgi:hypothetical protein
MNDDIGMQCINNTHFKIATETESKSPLDLSEQIVRITSDDLRASPERSEGKLPIPNKSCSVDPSHESIVTTKIINHILNREHIYNEIKSILLNFDRNFFNNYHKDGLSNEKKTTSLKKKTKSLKQSCNFPSQATENWSSPSLRSGEAVTSLNCETEDISIKNMKKNKTRHKKNSTTTPPEDTPLRNVFEAKNDFFGMKCRKIEVEQNTNLHRDNPESIQQQVDPPCVNFKGFTGTCEGEAKNDFFGMQCRKINGFDGGEAKNEFFGMQCRKIEDIEEQTFSKKGIYVYGSPGCGKTEFVNSLLKEMKYDVISYDAGDVRNKALIDNITSNNISNYNVLQMMKGIKTKIAIIMDEIDGMNNGDKGGITSLIKLIRQKKTKKQKLENKTVNPIICIGNYYVDKKINELIKVCNSYELKPPTREQMKELLKYIIPETQQFSRSHYDTILNYVQNDMRKLFYIRDLYRKNPQLVSEKNIKNVFHLKLYNEDPKINTQKLFKYRIPLEHHNKFMNETDRTIIALLWHENIIDKLEKDKDVSKKFHLYLKVLSNFCYADYIDRITFQNQIWNFNEMSSLMKTFHNNTLYHEKFLENSESIDSSENDRKSSIKMVDKYDNDKYSLSKDEPIDIRFTKVLTKYSTEYNNILFFFRLCQEMDMDKKDLIAFFQEMRVFYGEDFLQKPEIFNKIEEIFSNYNINKLDIRRVYRYLDKNVKKDSNVSNNENMEDEIESNCDENEIISI